MQSSLEFFCEECGAANTGDATVCVACQHSLAQQVVTPPAPAPVKIVPAAAPQVVAGVPLSSGPLRPGKLLAGRYRIVREIGQGGFGAVYKARDVRKRGRLVAIKQINLARLNPREIITATDAFNREITFLSTLSHPHLPKIYAHFTDANHWYLVMEYIEGQTLEEYLRKSRRGYLPMKQVLKIGLALIDVLDYLHSRRPPVIFRDLKPANIMLTRRGQIYLIDFGIARRFAPEKRKDTGPLGSPGYAAPEQYGRAQTDERTDIYSLGATLQTLLTGRDPLELHQGLSSLRPEPLPAELQELLDSMLEANPEKRPRRVSEIEDQFSHGNRRVIDRLAVGKGVLTGLAFWSWYILLEVGVNTLRNTIPAPADNPPFLVRLFLVILNLFPVALLGTAFLQILLIMFLEKKRQFAVTLLVLLVLLILALLLAGLPPLFQGYPFYSSVYP